MACGVFRPLIESFGLNRLRPGQRLVYLPSNLHLRPDILRASILNEIAAARSRGERVLCLYGECFPEIKELLEEQGVMKVPGLNCHEMLLGAERYLRLLEESAGIYFMEQELIINFEEYCLGPLELHDDEMREAIFGPYTRLVYVRQPSDPDLVDAAKGLAEFLEMTLTVEEADYSHIRERLERLIRLY